MDGCRVDLGGGREVVAACVVVTVGIKKMAVLTKAFARGERERPDEI